jgi:hypothetical protein
MFVTHMLKPFLEAAEGLGWGLAGVEITVVWLKISLDMFSERKVRNTVVKNENRGTGEHVRLHTSIRLG